MWGESWKSIPKKNLNRIRGRNVAAIGLTVDVCSVAISCDR